MAVGTEDPEAIKEPKLYWITDPEESPTNKTYTRTELERIGAQMSTGESRIEKELKQCQ